LAVLVENAAAEFRPQVDIRDSANVDRCPRAGHEDDVLNICSRADQADAPDGHLLVACLNHLRPDVGITALNALDDRAQRDVVSAQLAGINVDRILRYPAAA